MISAPTHEEWETRVRKQCYLCGLVVSARRWGSPSVLDLLDEHYTTKHGGF